MPELGKLNVPGIVEPGTEKTIGPVGAAQTLAQRCKAFTMRSAQSAVVARLASHPTIAAWVEEGVALHTHHASETCEFCAQPLPAARLQALADHFSVEDQQLKAEIDQERVWVATVLEALGGFTLPDRLALYSELRADYDAAVSGLEAELEAVKQRVIAIDGALADKLTQRNEAYVSVSESDAEALKAKVTAYDSLLPFGSSDLRTGRLREPSSKLDQMVNSGGGAGEVRPSLTGVSKHWRLLGPSRSWVEDHVRASGERRLKFVRWLLWRHVGIDSRGSLTRSFAGGAG